MSAWVVSKATIDAIVTWARSTNLVVADPSGDGPDTGVRNLDPSVIGQILWNENYLSVNHRYSEGGTPPKYEFAIRTSGCIGFKRVGQYANRVHEKPIIRELTTGDVVKLCRCLDYQSCEHDGWKTSWACGFLAAIQNAASGAKIAEDAPWGLYDEPKPSKKRKTAT